MVTTKKKSTGIGGRGDAAPLAVCSDSVLVGVGHEVRAYSLATLEQLGTFAHHSGPVRHLAPTNAMGSEQVLSCGEDGLLHVWSQETYTPMLSSTLGAGTLASASAVLDDAAASGLNRRMTTGHQHRAGESVVVTAQRSERSVVLAVTSITDSSVRTVLGEAPDCLLLACSQPAPHTVACAAGSRAHAFCLGWAPGTADTLTTPTGAEVTALAVHPFDPTVTIGDATGRLSTYYLDPEKGPSAARERRVVHWHAHPVGFAQWSPDGSSVVTGGEEAVFVQWNAATWSARRLPRLPGPLVAAAWAADSSCCMVACAPNALLKVDPAEMQLKGITHGVDLLQGAACGTLTPIGGTRVAVAGQPGMLRVFEAGARRYIASVRTTPGQAHMSRIDVVALPRVTTHSVAFSSDGSMMATIDRSDVTFGDREQESLRFWVWTKNEWALDTVVNSPHGGATGGVTFFPRGPRALTVGSDGLVKRWAGSAGWQHRETAEIPGAVARGAQKRPVRTASQNGAAAAAAGAAAAAPAHEGCLCVSPDGSVAVVSAGCGAAVMAADPFGVLGELRQHLTPDPLLQLTFTSPTRQEGRPLVGGRTGTHVFLWDLNAGALLWGAAVGSATALRALPAAVAARCPAGGAGGMLAVAAAGKLLLFGGAESCPLAAAELPGCTAAGGGGAELCVVSNESCTALVYADDTRRLRCVQPAELDGAARKLLSTPEQLAASAAAQERARAGAARRVEQRASQRDNLAALFGAAPAEGEAAPAEGAAPRDTYKATAALEAVYSGAPHLLPPPSATIDKLLDALLTHD